MYKAVFLDMDGTLLRTDHSVSEPTRQTLRKLTQMGIPVILVSARPVGAMLPTARETGVADFPLVSLNGSYIVEKEQTVFQAIIDPETVGHLTREIAPLGATIAYYVQREWYAEVDDAWTTHEQKIMDVRLRVQPFDKMAAAWSAEHTGPNKLMAMSEPPRIDLIQKHLIPLFGDRLNIYPSKPTYLEIMDRRASKANAIRLLSERMQIPREETLAIGDNFNDREMIRFAGMGVAMGNAPDEIKAEAAYVTDTNNNDGVRKALEHLMGV